MLGLAVQQFSGNPCVKARPKTLFGKNGEVFMTVNCWVSSEGSEFQNLMMLSQHECLKRSSAKSLVICFPLWLRQVWTESSWAQFCLCITTWQVTGYCSRNHLQSFPFPLSVSPPPLAVSLPSPLSPFLPPSLILLYSPFSPLLLPAFPLPPSFLFSPTLFLTLYFSPTSTLSLPSISLLLSSLPNLSPFFYCLPYHK